MSYQTSSQKFGGIVFASDIEPAECMLDYINGKAQFYAENQHYVVMKSKSAGQLKSAFSMNDYQPNQTSKQVHSPQIYYKHTNGMYFRNFSIVWRQNTATDVKDFYVMSPFGGWSVEKKCAIKTDAKPGTTKKFNIPVFSSTLFEESIDDQKLAILGFHLNEVLVILMLAYIFNINLAADAYTKIHDNKTFYDTFINDINKALKEMKCPTTVEPIDEEFIEKYNMPVVNTPDPEAFGMDVKPNILAYKTGDEDEPYDVLPTLMYNVEKMYVSALRSKFAFAKHLTKTNAFDMLSKIIPLKIPQEKIMYRAYEAKAADSEETYWKHQFQVKGSFRIMNSDDPEDIEKCKNLCTNYFNDETGWTPIDNEEYLMNYYRSTCTGDLYIGLEYVIGLFMKPSFGLIPRITKIDLTKSVKGEDYEDESTKLALQRRQAQKSGIAQSGRNNVIVSDDDLEQYDQISEDE